MRIQNHPTTTPARAPRNTRTAFTLLEVLVVVAIIVMLAGVGGYLVVQRYEESKVSRAKMDVRGLAGQIQQYKLSYHEYPASIDMLAMPRDGNAPMVRQDALIDPWGKPYQFQLPDETTTFEPIVFTVSPKGLTISSAQMAQ
jgi:general secretion pathway protein G